MARREKRHSDVNWYDTFSVRYAEIEQNRRIFVAIDEGSIEKIADDIDQNGMTR